MLPSHRVRLLGSACALLLWGSGTAIAQSIAIQPLGSGGGQQAQPAQPAPDSGQRRSVEAQGSGSTEVEARASAVRAALEDVVGVYMVSSRRSELRVQGSAVRESFEQNMVAHVNGFVERVTTLKTWRDGNEVNVLIRAEVVMTRVLEAMRASRIPMIPIDQSSTVAALQTQGDRDETARQLVAQYLADLPKNIEVQLGRTEIKVLSSNPAFASIMAPISFRIKPEYVERGHALMREMPEDIDMTRSSRGNTSLTLCAARFRTAPPQFNQGNPALACRGIGVSREIIARIQIDERDAFLVGNGTYDLAAQNALRTIPGADTNGGIFVGLQVLDATGEVVAEGSRKIDIQCASSTPFESTNVPLERWWSSYAEQERRQVGQTAMLMHVFPASTERNNNARPTPTSCSYRYGQMSARFLGNSRTPPEQHLFYAVVPRAAMEQAANLRLSMSWTP